jgi:hypothetical protein
MLLAQDRFTVTTACALVLGETETFELLFSDLGQPDGSGCGME